MLRKSFEYTARSGDIGLPHLLTAPAFAYRLGAKSEMHQRFGTMTSKQPQQLIARTLFRQVKLLEDRQISVARRLVPACSDNVKLR